MELVVSSDTLIADVHFPAATDPAAIGYKALAVNLSDLAAMGALPAWFTLNLSIPQSDPKWLADFARGLFNLARVHNVQLIGGDTTRGPLSISIQVHGFVPSGQALLRSGAKPGDQIYVSGTLGDAGLGLRLLQQKLTLSTEYRSLVLNKLNYPLPRIELGLALRTIASACIDVSDGLTADLRHILEASQVGARIALAQLPLSAAYRASQAQVGWDTALGHGDDYELCFTVPGQKQQIFERMLPVSCGVTPIGTILAGAELEIVDTTGQYYRPQMAGYDHFVPNCD